MNTSPMILLIAEDDDDDFLLTQKALSRSHVVNEIRRVHDGEELMDYLLHRRAYAAPASAPRPVLILLDLNMPRKDGREALRDVKADPALCDISVPTISAPIRTSPSRRTFRGWWTRCAPSRGSGFRWWRCTNRTRSPAEAGPRISCFNVT
jgi:CheY-like chemotaxis protein